MADCFGEPRRLRQLLASIFGYFSDAEHHSILVNLATQLPFQRIPAAGCGER